MSDVKVNLVKGASVSLLNSIANKSKEYRDDCLAIKEDIIEQSNQFISDAEGSLITFNANYNNKVNDFNSNAVDKTGIFDSNVVDKTNEFDSYTQDKQDEFNTLYNPILNKLDYTINTVEPKIDEILATETELNDVYNNISLINIVGSDLGNYYEFVEDYGTLTEPVVAESGTSAIRTVSENIDSIALIVANIDDVQTAGINAQTATDKALESSGYADSALDSKNSASLSESNSNAYMLTTEGYKNTTLGYMNTTEGYMNTATTKATESSTSASNALTSENNANISANNASSSELLASKYANENEDVEVESGTYSAKHYMLKAQDIVATAMIDDSTVSTIKTYSSSKVVSLLDDKLSQVNGVIDFGTITDSIN